MRLQLQPLEFRPSTWIPSPCSVVRHGSKPQRGAKRKWQNIGQAAAVIERVVVARHSSLQLALPPPHCVSGCGGARFSHTSPCPVPSPHAMPLILEFLHSPMPAAALLSPNSPA